MCGGQLDIVDGATVCTCDYCGTEQTLPRLDSDKKQNLYDRANHFRRNNDYDKAMSIYEQILNEDNTDAESYWSLVICKYGIEYVEDPTSHKRIPTVNRAQYTSIFDDEDYKSALKYADTLQKTIYKREAKTINEIQKGILAISNEEEPFDVFICYKETDEAGKRTRDSVYANELYHLLEQEGFKVFFARITLEDKLGQEYEPYIFAALNSAKAMVVLGTKPEYFNAVWVKNEWSRYLALIKKGEKKVLIPAYKDMDPYDLPEEFSHLQAQDMSKLGFMQDLIRGIKKILKTDDNKDAVVKETVINTGNVNTAPLLRRAFMFLEDTEWDSAYEYCEKVLDIEPENAYAYLGKLLSELKVRKQEYLRAQAEPFDSNNNYKKAIRYADNDLKTTLIGYIDYINTRNENARLDGIYTRAKDEMTIANTEEKYKKAARIFETINGYKDADMLAKKCLESAEIERKDNILREAKSLMTGTVADCEEAVEMFIAISGWRDADEQVINCQKNIEELRVKEKKEQLELERRIEIAQKVAKRNKRISVIIISVVCVIIVFIIVLEEVIIPNVKYNKAIAMMDGKYNNAVALMEEGNIIEAYDTFMELDGYKDSADKAVSIYEQYKVEKLKAAKVGDYVFFGAYEQDNKADNGKEDIEWLVLEVKDGKALVISKYALDCKQYNSSHTDITWEKSSLRKWLNDDFINSAFSDDEKKEIVTGTVPADENPGNVTDPGNATQDQVFLLSIVEANKYFDYNDSRKCKPTAYAIANGAYVNGADGYCWWWLRSPGNFQDRAAFVDSYGLVSEVGDDVGDTQDLYEYGLNIDHDNDCVRPALWIDLNY